ncbi:hypothetical protein [Candidatus Leptofilum sp.]|uniref:hypothetical protein n=1 Tax=Candidatus Leptofilum sp. TaxID=3241576 RepID=UPI003B5B4ABB
MTTLGAPAALHGYRVQALYTLKRILTQADNKLVFHPENQEDLDVFSEDGKALELIQVKKYSPLQLSDLEPEKTNCFFRRILKKIDSSKMLTIKLVNFGTIGPELKKAWAGDEQKRKIVANKLKKFEYTEEQVATLFDHVEMNEEVNEVDEEATVFGLLSDLHTGIDPANAFNLLHYWIFNSMENRSSISYSDVIEKLNSVGRWQAERRDFHNEWFTTIQPIEATPNVLDNYDSLKREFFEGGFTNYSHIVADLDFQRAGKAAEIKAAFAKSNIVIVHAASGQGKTTIALRYLHDHYPNDWRFSIARIENVKHALSAANALSGFASALQAPVAVHMDVNPRDRDWIELARQLAKHPYLNILITVREEDYRRANVSTFDFNYEPIDLHFNENEARKIFERAQAHQLQNRFLNFSSAWNAFGSGPLLEFVHLLTQTETLRQRLESQVNRIRNEVREKHLDTNELHLLRLVAVATAFEARINTLLLIKSLKLPEPGTTLNYFENEYLIRLNNEGLLEGLHAIRSKILVDLLTDEDVNLWEDLASEVFAYLVEDDLEQFILNAAIERAAEFEKLHYSITDLRPTTWRGVAGVLRALVWVDINRYVLANRNAIDAAKAEFGAGWFFIANLYLPSEDAPKIDSWWESDDLSSLFTPERIERLNAIRAMQPPKDNIFNLSKSWLESVAISLNEPDNIQDWLGIAFVLYWASFLGLEHISSPMPDTALPFFALSDVIYALHKYDPSSYTDWLNENETHLLGRLANEMQILALEANDDLLTIHFLVLGTEIEQRKNKDPFHAAAGERLQFIRQLYPDYDKYGIQGYGHKLGEALKLDIDGTKKPGVARKYLVPNLVTWANSVATGIARFNSRLEDWSAYVDVVLKKRRAILTCINQLQQGLEAYISNRKPVNIGKVFVQVDDWKACSDLLSDSLDLPKPAVDPWGFASETREESKDFLSQLQQDNISSNNIPEAIAYQIYQPYLSIQQTYFTHFQNFLNQSVDVMVTNYNLAKLTKKIEWDSVKAELIRRGIKIDGAHLCTHNFWDAKQLLIKYQSEFKRLFGHIKEGTLPEIESEEQALILQTWLLWHHYAHTPRHTLKKPARNVIQNVEKAKGVIDRWINRAISRFNSKNQKAQRLMIDLKWDEKSTLIIQLDVLDPTNLYEAFEQLMRILNSRFRSLRYEDLKHYLFQEYYEQIVVIPTFCGYLANENAWTLYSLSTILNKRPVEEQNWVSYRMQPLTPAWIEALGLKLWDDPQIEMANEISAIISSLTILVSQISELKDLPEEIDDSAMELLKTYTAERSQILSDLLQKFFDHGAILIDQFNSLSDDEKANRPYLGDAISLFQEVYQIILPSDSETGEHRLDLEMINDYANRLTEIFLAGEYLRLMLISDALST